MDELVARYRGRTVTEADVAFIQELIARHPQANRKQLSKELCEAWGWRQANGHLKDGVCRQLMLWLHRQGHIQLPAPRCRANNRRSASLERDVRIDQTLVRASLKQLLPLTFRQVRRTTEEPLFDALLAEHHELGYTQPVGEHMKLLVLSGERAVAALVFSSAPHGLQCRDRFIGWSREARKRNRHLLAYNSRFLVPPWVQVPHLASHVLGWMGRNLSAEWQRLYAHPIHFLETFVDPTRHRGTCYRAANWIRLGQTTGRGHRSGAADRGSRPIKEVLGYPVTPRFRQLLTEPSAGTGTDPASTRA